MFKQILVPLDGSERAERALPVAARIARAQHASLILLRVVPTLVEYGPYMRMPGIPIEFEQQVIEQDMAQAKKYLETVAAMELMAGIPHEIQAQIAQGDAGIAEHILSFIQSRSIDLVIMCSHGYAGLKRWAFGSVAHKLVRHCPIPVLVLRGRDDVLRARAGQTSVRVLVGLDGSTLAEAALEPAIQLSCALSSPAPGALHLARVLPLPPPRGIFRHEGFAEAHERIIAEEKSYLDDIAQRIHSEDKEHAGLSISSSLVIQKDVASSLIGIAEKSEDVDHIPDFTGCDVIALTTHGRSGLDHWALGSVAERILETTSLPLLVVHSVTHKTSPQDENVGEQAEHAAL